MNRNIEQWLDSGGYLPGILKDFHDQKDIFKRIDEIVTKRSKYDNAKPGTVNWVDAHIYTIDIFLWFMAAHGYTLQKSKAKVSFCDLTETIKDFRGRRIKSLQNREAGGINELPEGTRTEMP